MGEGEGGHDKATECELLDAKKPHVSWHVTPQVEQHLFPPAAEEEDEEVATFEGEQRLSVARFFSVFSC